jgi:hypothetical protein
MDACPRASRAHISKESKKWTKVRGSRAHLSKNGRTRSLRRAKNGQKSEMHEEKKIREKG